MMVTLLPGPPAPATSPRTLAYMIIRALLLGLAGALTVVLSVVASALGLSLLLVVAAIGSLTTLNIRQQTRQGYTPHRSRKALFVSGLVVVGFFIVISVVGAYWPK